MSFSAGVYTLPGAALNTGDTVSATENNTLRNDMATAFNKTWLRDGTAAATADIPLGNFSLTGATSIGSATSLALKSNNGTTAVTIDASQNVGIGTSSPTAKLTIADATAPKLNLHVGGNERTFISYTEATALTRIDSDGSIVFAPNNTEYGRFTDTGNLLVGTTTAPTNGTVLSVRNSAATAGKKWNYGPNTSSNFTVYNQSDVGVYIVDGATSWTATSDERVKTPLVPFANAMAKVATLRAGTGRYLADEEDVSRSFLIAQDVQAVLPEAVDAQDDEQKTLGLRYTDVIPLLVAAIQEQQTLITTLTERITALEAK